MSIIRIWAAAVCAAAVAASVAQLAAPEGKVQKALRCVIGLFFVCCIMAPFSQGLSFQNQDFEPAMAFAEQTTDRLSAEILRQTADGFAGNVHKIVEKILSDRQVFPKEIGVSVHVEENDNIYINSITIRLEETVSNKEEISQVVQEQTGITPEILEESEEAS